MAKTVFKQEKPKRSSRTPVNSDQIKRRDHVADGKFFKVDVQVGPYIVGSMPGSNRWTKLPGGAYGDPEKLTPEYKVWSQTLPSEAVNGLIETHNTWADANAKKAPDVREGLLGNMVAVLHTEELSGYVPPNTTYTNVDLDLLSVMIDKLVAERLPQKQPKTT